MFSSFRLPTLKFALSSSPGTESSDHFLYKTLSTPKPYEEFNVTQPSALETETYPGWDERRKTVLSVENQDFLHRWVNQ